MVMAEKSLTVSIVSHGQGELVRTLLLTLREHAEWVPMTVIVTYNTQEVPCAVRPTEHFDVISVCNRKQKGFAENHNAAFALCKTRFFCVLNPDIQIDANSFIILMEQVRRHPGVAGPRVINPSGNFEDNARRVPSVWRLAQRWILGKFLLDYSADVPHAIEVDWLAGMCLMFDAETFRLVGGFDSRYRLYCEDIDICLRIHLLRRCVTWVCAGVVIHDARRDSHRNFRFFLWHVSSLAKLLTSFVYWRFRISHRM